MKMTKDTKERLRKLRAKLPRNYGNVIAERLKTDRQFVYRVAHGEKHDDAVMEALCRLAIMEAEDSSRLIGLLEKATA